MRAPLAVLILDFNDSEITLWRDDALLYRAPGVAHVDDAQVLFGDEAAQRSRLYPGQSHDQFWRRLNAEAVAPPGPTVANQADLVYLHLKAILDAANANAGEDLVALAPGAITGERLSLFLGIAREVGARVRAVVDGGVAGAATGVPPADLEDRTCAVLDVTRHGGVVSTIDVAGAEVRRRNVVEVVEAGVNTVFEGWIALAADRFVTETRLDPLRIAATEQQLFDRLWELVSAGEGTRIELSHDDGLRRVDVPREALARKAARNYDALAAAVGAADAIAVTHRAARLPGLTERMRQLQRPVVELPEDALRQAVLDNAERILGDGTTVRYLTALASRRGTETATPAPQSAAPARYPPTHLLCAGVAVPLQQCPDASDHPACEARGPAFDIRVDDTQVHITPTSDDATTGDGPLRSKRPAWAGDTVLWQGIEFRLIAVEP